MHYSVYDEFGRLDVPRTLWLSAQYTEFGIKYDNFETSDNKTFLRIFNNYISVIDYDSGEILTEFYYSTSDYLQQRDKLFRGYICELCRKRTHAHLLSLKRQYKKLFQNVKKRLLMDFLNLNGQIDYLIDERSHDIEKTVY